MKTVKAFFLSWRSFQDVVVRHPLCRYTILPAGLFVAIWLSGAIVVNGVWQEYGRNAFCFMQDGIPEIGQDRLVRPLLIGMGLTGWLLTGRWLPMLSSLLMTPVVFAYLQYGPRWSWMIGLQSDKAFAWERLAVFIPALLWLLYLDWKSVSRPVLSWWMKGLVGLAVVFWAAVLALWIRLDSSSGWVKDELKLSWATAIWSAFLFDLVWRTSYDRFGRILRNLLVRLNNS
jgi:hypothetical protein